MSKVTIDHTEIKAWAEKFQGKPEFFSYPNASIEEVGLRIDFPGPEDDVFLSDSEPPKDVSWEDFFTAFDQQQLAFIYEEKEKISDPSDAYRFIKRELADEETA